MSAVGWRPQVTAGCLKRRLRACRKARNKLAQRPWRVDDLDAFSDRWFNVADGDASMLLPSVSVCVSVHASHNILTTKCSWPDMLLLSLHCCFVCICQAPRKAVSLLASMAFLLFLCQEVCFQAVICCEINCLWACMASLKAHNQPQLSGGRSAQRQAAVTACKGCACCATNCLWTCIASLGVQPTLAVWRQNCCNSL